MSTNTVKIDEAGFNRGVNEVLRMRPFVRVARSIVAKYSHNADQGKESRDGQQRDITPRTPDK